MFNRLKCLQEKFDVSNKVAPQLKFPRWSPTILIHGSTQIRYVKLKIDPNVDLLMYLIEGIKLGTWKDGHLNWAFLN